MKTNRKSKGTNSAALPHPNRVTGKTARSLGPVSDLERHLPSDWWSTLFNSFYLKTDGDVVENQANTSAEVDLLIDATGIKPTDAILDVCCGQGRHAIELARRGYKQVQGIDRSRYLIRLARRRAKEEGLKIQFSEGDARNMRVAESSKDCIYIMGNSFGYFEREEDDVAVLDNIKRFLKSQGKLVLDVVDGNWMSQNFETRSWEWIDQRHFVNRERSLAADGKRIITREVITQSDLGVIADQFYAERLYDYKELAQILAELGYENVKNVASIEAQSTRGQDLGMMAHRLFITCDAPEKEIAAKPIPKPQAITVLMGDPKLPDTVKRNGQFNQEDMNTIHKLKDALATLPQFKTVYLDDHRTLMKQLISNPPDFVFNLCDEGFKNRATQELHVPALLEMLEIPYTGAAPGCLSLCYDKSKVHAIAASMEIPVPLETYFHPGDQAANIPAIFPALLKPARGDSSIGITQGAVVHDAQELVAYLSHLQTEFPGVSILVQEYLQGAEYSVTLIGNPPNFEPLPLLEVDYSKLPADLPKILSYESKWIPDSPYWTQIQYREATVSEELRNQLINYSKQLFERTECRDYARFDFRCDATGTPKLLEVNPNPGWCWDGKMNLMAGFAGMDYEALLNMILQAALERINDSTMIHVA